MNKPDTPITRTHSGQCAVNIAILNHVRLQGQASHSELFGLYCIHPLTDERARKQFASKLAYLVYTEQLKREGGQGLESVFSLGHMAGQRPPSSAKAKAVPAKKSVAVAPEDSYLPRHVQAALPVVPPRQIDVMHGDTWTPPPAHVARPGAMDFRRYGSRGDRC